MRKNTAEQLRLLGVEKFPEGPVKSLPVAALQLIEIAKALLRQSRVVIMDEPNSALSEQESRKLFDIIRSLKARGISIIYISHRLEEVLGLVDRITVLRDGCYIGTYEAAATSLQEIIDLMLGRKLENMFPTREHVSAPAAEPLLKLDRVSKEKKLHEVSLDLHEKEIVGIFGLEGSGRQEIAEILYGLLQPDSGGIAISGRKTILGSPIAAKARGIAYVPADRKWEGLVLGQDIRTNISLSILAKVCRFGILRNGFLSALVKRYIHKLNLKCSSMYQKAVDLSGGNQQKVVLSKALATEPRIIVLNEPTRGIDIGAKREIYDQIFELARDGLGVLFISSELPEIMALSDRIFVICGGTIRAEVKSEEVTENQVLALACGA
jgi:ABC-type sugar transport system ATPase subunit